MTAIDELTIQCPYCFESVVLTLERDLEGIFVQDCSVCCNPWTLEIKRNGDGNPSVSVERS